MRGRFITVEGIEGVGKSTNLQFIADRLQRAGIDVTVTREPGGTALAEELRRVVLHAAEPVPDDAELLLMFAARSLHVTHVIRPALARGGWVLCDRFTDATRAYQGAGRGQPMERIDTLASWVHGDLVPDLTVLLDAPVAHALARTRGRGSEDRFERENDEFFQRVRAGYLQLAAEEPERIVTIDAGAALAAVQRQLATLVDIFISKHIKNNK